MHTDRFRQVRAVIFDLDNTLYHADRAYAAALQACGVPPETYRRARATVKTRLPEGHTSAHNRVLYFKALLEAEGRFAPLTLLQLVQRYETCLRHSIRHQVTQARTSFWLGKLAASFALVLLTNENTRSQILKMAEIDPEGRWFRHIMTSEEVGCEKPAAAMFEAAQSALGCAPQEIVMVGDSMDDDIVPALQLGLHAIHFTAYLPPHAATHALAVKSFPELCQLLHIA
jgi:ribulose-1,5-bisphosphate 5-phosphatase